MFRIKFNNENEMKRKNITLDYYELERFLNYLNDKVEDVYSEETTNEINRRLQRLKNNQTFEEQFD